MSECSCVICGESLTTTSASREHVIPNALGGHLITRRATCVDCNSTTGATHDKDLVTIFAPLLAVLDVVRSRGETQPFRFKDDQSGEGFVIQPGGPTTKDVNFSKQDIDGKSHYFLHAPTEEEARMLVKKFTKSGKRNIDVSPIEQCRDTYTWKLNTKVLSPTLLSAAARMAVYFARHSGIDVAMSSPAIRYISGHGEVNNIVTPVHGEILRPEGDSTFEVSHGIFLRVFPESRQCFVYVILFQYIEYMVFLGCVDVPPCEYGYKVNLVSGKGAAVETVWACSEEEILPWFIKPKMCTDRMLERLKPLLHYVKNPRQVSEDRAILRGGDAYFEALRDGKSQEEASAAALLVANGVLARHGITLESWSVTARDEH